MSTKWYRRRAEAHIQKNGLPFFNCRTNIEFRVMYVRDTHDIQYHPEGAVQPGDTILDTVSDKKYIVGDIRNSDEAWQAEVIPFHLTGTVYRFTATERDPFGHSTSAPEVIATEIPVHFAKHSTIALTFARIELLHGDMITVIQTGESFLVRDGAYDFVYPVLQRLVVVKQCATQVV